MGEGLGVRDWGLRRVGEGERGRIAKRRRLRKDDSI
jgi:hypothetical protein